jgi:hypothetical protein
LLPPWQETLSTQFIHRFFANHQREPDFAGNLLELRASGFRSRTDVGFWLGDHVSMVRGEPIEHLSATAGPFDREAVDRLIIAQAEVRDRLARRLIAAADGELAYLNSGCGLQSDSRSCAQAV